MSDERRVPALLLERLARDELSDAKRTEVLARLAEEPNGADRLTELEASDRAILTEIPPATFRAGLDEKLGRRRRARALWTAIPMTVAAVAVFAVIPGPAGHDGTQVESTRLKGSENGATLVVLKDGSRLADGDLVNAGDVLQLAILTAEPVYAVVFSIDGRNQVTVLEPADTGSATAFPSGAAIQAISVSYELDDAPERETFFLVTSSQVFATSMVLNLAEAWTGGPLDLPDSFIVDRFEIRKPK